MIEIETRYGQLLVPDTASDLIGRCLARYGEWAWDEAYFVASTLPDGGGRVLDAGAFAGTFGLGMALLRPLEFVCFVEANSLLIPLLLKNVTCNCRAPTAVTEGLLGWPRLAIRDGLCDPSNIGATSFVGEHHGTMSSISPINVHPKRVVTLAELRAEHGDFDLIKLDLEGMELGVLHSNAEQFARGETSIWVECRDEPLALEIAELLLSWGLELYYFAFPAHNPDNYLGNSDQILPLAYEGGLLAAPKRLPLLDEKLLNHGCILRKVHCVEDVKTALWRTPRWGDIDWLGASRAEIVALAGRALRGEYYESYLGLEWQPKPLLDAGVWARLEATEAALKYAESLAHERYDLLEAERERADDAETRMARACVEALDRLSELGFTRERVADLEVRAAAAEYRITVLESSSIWCLGTHMRRLIMASPRLKSLIRHGRAIAARIHASIG
jgi:FkbM family methyltransferase